MLIPRGSAHATAYRRGNPFGDPPVGESASLAVEVSGMTIKHEVWLADALGGSAMLFALYFVLREFASTRLP